MECAKNLHGVIIELDVSRQQYNKAVELLNEFIMNSSIYKYNYMGLIDGLLNNEACYSDRFLCSEFVYYILNSLRCSRFKHTEKSCETAKLA